LILRPARDNAQFMRPVLVNRFLNPDLEKARQLSFQTQAITIMLVSPKPKNKSDVNSGTQGHD